MKKTILQQVFSELERLHPSLFDIHTEKGRTFVNKFWLFLNMEEVQTVNAFLKGVEFATEEDPSWSIIGAREYFKNTYQLPIKNGHKHYRVWFPDVMEAVGGYWWYCKLNDQGYLYDPEHDQEEWDTLEWYLQNGYKVEEVTND